MAAMTSMMTNSPLFFLLLFLVPLLASCADQKQSYIVYLGHHGGDKTFQEIEDNHYSYLFSVKATEEDARSSLIYSYKHSINGFAARLTADEASKLSQMEEVISVSRSYPEKYTLHTTRSWEFIGLEEDNKPYRLRKEGLLMKSKYGKDVIVGMVDNGVWPESQSFNDEGMGPIPSRWKGVCVSGDAFNSSHCNKKIIGARYYIKGYEAQYGPLNRTLDALSPRDMDGHGTHTASTVGGRRVPNASDLGGYARGTASGGAPLVRLAIYKACWSVPGLEKAESNTCFGEDLLAAMDDAIADGVDVLSLSIGTSKPVGYYDDPIAFGAIHATKKNIIVSCSAGNNGPNASSLANPAPWIITVAASTLDRGFVAPLQLGNGMIIEGQSIAPNNLEKKMYPLVYAAQVINPNVPKNESGYCLPGSLSPEKTKGKIVFCARGVGARIAKGLEVKRAGGVGFILGNSKLDGNDLEADSHFVPATQVTYTNARKIYKYILSTKNPTVYLMPGSTILHTKPAPAMAVFSSRGPNIISLDVLKPDITGPGVYVLAAWSEGSSPTKLDVDHRVTKYNLLSGTSMSNPHVAASCALLRAMHPKWSSAAVRSALITSAGLRNNKGDLITDYYGNPADPFQFGAGHFRPTKAADPGLIYDASYLDYILFICGSGYSSPDPSSPCPRNPPHPRELNYPSLAIPALRRPVTVQRTVTNVGSHWSVYFASVKPPPGIKVEIWPPILFFRHAGEKRTFTITVRRDIETVGQMAKGQYSFGWYTWNDGFHNVRSPIAVALA